MFLPAMLSRSEFDQACKTYIRCADGGKGYESSIWQWNDDSLYSLGYMSRKRLFAPPLPPAWDFDNADYVLDGTVDDENDEATVPSSPACTSTPSLIVHEHVAYSATFRVPTFYFSIHRSDGSPLSLDDIMKTGFIRKYAIPPTEPTSFALVAPDSPFPLLSYGDHPTLGTPLWYFHPCETSKAVGEIMAEADHEGWMEDDRLARWMQVWFMVLAAVVDLAQ